MKLPYPWFLALLLLPVASAADPTPPATPKAEEKPKSGWVFSLLPKSVQQNPNLDLTVVTEVTDAGKKFPQASPQKPIYYQPVSSGYHPLGDTSAADNAVSKETILRILERSLTANGYLPEKLPEHPATIAVFYVWGSDNLFVEPDPDNPTTDSEKVTRNILDRAALVGGEKFAAQMLQLFVQANEEAAANTQLPVNDPSGEVTAIAPVMGQDQLDFSNPVYRFKQRNVKNAFLVDQAVSDCYYVVASAYDYKELSKRKILLWRTRMTCNSQGVSQEQSLPALIASAGPYFGKEMPEPEILTKRSVREGKVDVGPATVVPDSDKK
jgi:hypothetical protein